MAAWAIRHFFHADPDKLTLRRFVDLGGKGLAFIREIQHKQPASGPPQKSEHF